MVAARIPKKMRPTCSPPSIIKKIQDSNKIKFYKYRANKYMAKN